MVYTARIEVQDSFCDGCSKGIKKELQRINEVKNIHLYPKDALITFNFMKANHLSMVLNLLSEIGYPEKGERNPQKITSSRPCNC